jgi:hypothetical protein
MSKNTGPPTRRSFAVIQGSESHVHPLARGMTKADARRMAADRRTRPGAAKRARIRVVPDRDLIDKPAGRGGLPGDGGPAATNRAKAAVARKRAADRARARRKRRGR